MQARSWRTQDGETLGLPTFPVCVTFWGPQVGVILASQTPHLAAEPATMVPTGASGPQRGWALGGPARASPTVRPTSEGQQPWAQEKSGESGTQLGLGTWVAMSSGALRSSGELGSGFAFWVQRPPP